MTKDSLAPIVLFVYNRPFHTQKTVEALQKNSLATDSVLYIFSDAPKNFSDEAPVAAVRSYLKKINGFKDVHIIEQPSNKGLMNSVIEGVTQIIDTHGKIIVLEDDLITSPFFLRYMNDALSLYANEGKVMHISAYMFPVKGNWGETFFYGPASCWGWGTWKRAWDKFNPSAAELFAKIKETNTFNAFNVDGSCKSFEDQLSKNNDGLLKTWAIKWYASVFINNGLCLHPKYSLVQNIGFDGSGINSVKSSKYNNDMTNHKIDVNKIELVENVEVRKAMRKFYNRGSIFNAFKKNLILPKKIIKKISKWLGAIHTKIRISFLYKKYSHFTMIPKNTFKANLLLCAANSTVKGAIVECGVWRGGMIAAISELLGAKKPCYLFDSFEGLPPAQQIDGAGAIGWQNDVSAPGYFDNCRAEMSFAQQAMSLSGSKDVSIIKGWFDKTLATFKPDSPIAILRLDGDWYESTMVCLEKLYKYVEKGGLIIIDDYYTWEGCARAVHEFLYKNNLSDRIQSVGKVCYIIKNK